MSSIQAGRTLHLTSMLAHLTRWTARATIVAAIIATPFLNLHATAMSIAFPAPPISSTILPTLLSNVPTEALIVYFAKLLALVAVASAKCTTFLAAAGISVHVPPALASALAALSANPAARHVGGGVTMALAGTLVTCVAFPDRSVVVEPEPQPTTTDPVAAAAVAALPLAVPAAPRRVMRMAVRGLDEKVSPARLFLTFPGAMQVEALYHKASGRRTAVVLTFDAKAPPKLRTATSLGATLNAVVHAPEATAEYTKKVWKREQQQVQVEVA